MTNPTVDEYIRRRLIEMIVDRDLVGDGLFPEMRGIYQDDEPADRR